MTKVYTFEIDYLNGPTRQEIIETELESYAYHKLINLLDMYQATGLKCGLNNVASIAYLR